MRSKYPITRVNAYNNAANNAANNACKMPPKIPPKMPSKMHPTPQFIPNSLIQIFLIRFLERATLNRPILLLEIIQPSLNCP
jgi:hypothetical protein